MNELKPEDVMRALDILDKMDFFQGQRAGRELWFEKPFEVQEQDIADFSQGIEFVKNLITNASTILREKDARIKELEEAQGAEFTCFVGGPHKVDHCPYCDEIVRLQKEVDEKDAEIERLYKNLNETAKEQYVNGRADAITEFFERVCKEVEQTPNANEFFISAWKAKFAEIANEMKG